MKSTPTPQAAGDGAVGSLLSSRHVNGVAVLTEAEEEQPSYFVLNPSLDWGRNKRNEERRRLPIFNLWASTEGASTTRACNPAMPSLPWVHGAVVAIGLRFIVVIIIHPSSWRLVSDVRRGLVELDVGTLFEVVKDAVPPAIDAHLRQCRADAGGGGGGMSAGNDERGSRVREQRVAGWRPPFPGGWGVKSVTGTCL